VGERGPAPKGEYPNKSKVFSTRIRPDVRAKLEAAVKASRRSLSQESEHRLRRTFIEDERIEDSFGSRRNFLIMRIVALVLQAARNPDQPDADWLDDPYAFNQAIETAMSVFYALRPPGPIPALSDPTMEDPHGWSPIIAARNLIEKIRGANPSLPLTARPRDQLFAGIVKSELGAVLDRDAQRWERLPTPQGASIEKPRKRTRRRK
jgi:hypothetical protein